jgi:hypothetical protein
MISNYNSDASMYAGMTELISPGLPRARDVNALGSCKLAVFDMKTITTQQLPQRRKEYKNKTIAFVRTNHGVFPAVDTILVFRRGLMVINISDLTPGDCAVSVLRRPYDGDVPSGMLDTTMDGFEARLFLYEIKGLHLAVAHVTQTYMPGIAVLHGSGYFIPC